MPGADFLVVLKEDWFYQRLTDLLDCPAVIRFESRGDDDRRVLHLLNYHSRFASACDPLTDVLAMVEQQRAA